MSIPEAHTLKQASELSMAQLGFIAKTHLNAPLEWGDRSYDHEETRRKMAEIWHKGAREGDDLFICAVTEGDEVKAFMWADKVAKPKHHIYIQSLWVDASLRRRGIARILKEKVEAWARDQGAGWVQTNVHSDNAAMLKLNESMGYKSTYIEQRKPLEGLKPS